MISKTATFLPIKDYEDCSMLRKKDIFSLYSRSIKIRKVIGTCNYSDVIKS